MIELLQKESLSLMKKQHFDCLGVVTVDFSTGIVDSFEIYEKKLLCNTSNLYFDLASITKAMTLTGVYCISPEIFTDEMLLLLEHRGGFPSWGRLHKKHWKEILLARKVKASSTNYSDLSALRLQLEIETQTQRPLYDTCSIFWHQEVHHWKDTPSAKIFPVTGVRRGKPICGSVNDDNAFFIEEKLSHAGLFATVEGMAKSFVNLNERYNLIERINKSFKTRTKKRRFIYGLDTIDTEESLAGLGCSLQTFGHLGFTGNSFWIDGLRYRGIGIFSNACYPYRYYREKLNFLRRRLGTVFWQL